VVSTLLEGHACQAGLAGCGELLCIYLIDNNEATVEVLEIFNVHCCAVLPDRWLLLQCPPSNAAHALEPFSHNAQRVREAQIAVFRKRVRHSPRRARNTQTAL